MAGLAGGSKIMALLVPTLVGLGVLVVLARRRPPLGRALGAALGFGVLALVLLSPWYVRNTVETGNPLYPFGQSVFAGRNWSMEAARYLDVYYDQYRTTEASQRGAKPYAGVDVARFPWDLTMHPESFENGKRQGQDTSPWMLAFIPALVLVRERRLAALAIAAIGAGYVTAIAVGAWAHPRYVLPGLALLMVAVTPAARALCGRRLFWLVVAVTVGGNLVLVSRMLRPMWPDQVRVALGRLSPEVFLSRYSDRYVFWHQANQAVPATGRVLVFEKIPHPYFIDRPFVLMSYLEQGMVDYRTVNTVERAARRGAPPGRDPRGRGRERPEGGRRSVRGPGHGAVAGLPRPGGRSRGARGGMRALCAAARHRGGLPWLNGRGGVTSPRTRSRCSAARWS